MVSSQCISITELRTNTKACLKEAEKEAKYIFVNNKPVAVIVNIEDYEANFLKPRLVELHKDEVDESLLQQAKQAKKTLKKDLLDI